MATDIHTTFGKLGFELWQTGGGCTAYGYNLGDEANSYILVTDGEDAIAPDDDTTSFSVGLYDEANSNDGSDTASNLSLSDAIKEISRLLRS